METVVLREDMAQAAELIREGKLIAVPTETVYGLACNGLDEAAVQAVYEVKGRPEQKPLSLMISGPEAIADYCVEVPRAAVDLAERFWPGPLTIVLKADSSVPEIVRAGGSTVGLRCPDHPLTLQALRLAGLPFAAPSANPSGAPSPTTAEAVLAYFDGKISAVIDGGPCDIGLASTVLDMSKTPYRILRPGALPEDVIADALAERLTCIGITGGSGCGKTTALLELEKRGALILDCDAVYHELLACSQELIGDIRQRFPGAVSRGKVDRRALGAIVFSNEAALRELNRITHRHISLELHKRLRSWAMQGGELAALDAIELIGSGLAAQCRATIGILADEELRVARIMERDGISRDSALMRIRAQKPDSYFVENCDYVLENNGDLQTFTEQFDGIIKEILKHG